MNIKKISIVALMFVLFMTMGAVVAAQFDPLFDDLFGLKDDTLSITQAGREDSIGLSSNWLEPVESEDVTLHLPMRSNVGRNLDMHNENMYDRDAR